MKTWKTSSSRDVSVGRHSPVTSSCIQCSAQQYFNNRLKYVDGLKSSGGTPYPHKFPVSTTLPEYVEAYKDLEGGQQLQDTTVSVAGRLQAGTQPCLLQVGCRQRRPHRQEPNVETSSRHWGLVTELRSVHACKPGERMTAAGHSRVCCR